MLQIIGKYAQSYAKPTARSRFSTRKRTTEIVTVRKARYFDQIMFNLLFIVNYFFGH
jgi:hypothetical protein